MALLIVKLNGDRFSPSSVCVFIVISGGLFLAFLFFLFFFVPTRIYIQLHRDKKKKKKSSDPTQEPEKPKANGLSIILMYRWAIVH